MFKYKMTSSDQQTDTKAPTESVALDDLAKDPEVGIQNGEKEASSKKRRKSRPVTSRSDGRGAELKRELKLEYNLVRKVIWHIVVIACASICLWHVSLRVLEYFRVPTSFQIKVQRVHSVQFPALTICPAREPFHEDTWRQAFELSGSLDLSKLDETMSDKWKEYSITGEDISATSSCDEKNVCNFIDGVNITLNTSLVPTLWGICFTLSRDTPMPYRGASTYIEIVLHPRAQGRQRVGRNVAAQLFFHDPQTAHSHEAILRADFWNLGRDTMVHLTLKQFDFLNTTRNRCDTQANVIECKNRCFDEKLDQVVNCRLPFMMAKWPPCQTAIEAKQAYDNIRDFYYSFNSSDCVCMRQCQENIYASTVTSEGGSPDNRTSIRIQYTDNLVEMVSEEYSYTFSALVSDIGGSLGMFLGLSILSAFKKTEMLVYKYKKNK